jgi:hypothetical protein
VRLVFAAALVVALASTGCLSALGCEARHPLSDCSYVYAGVGAVTTFSAPWNRTRALAGFAALGLNVTRADANDSILLAAWNGTRHAQIVPAGTTIGGPFALELDRNTTRAGFDAPEDLGAATEKDWARLKPDFDARLAAFERATGWNATAPLAPRPIYDTAISDL